MIKHSIGVLAISLALASAGQAATTIHLTQHNGYFSSQEAVGGLKAGDYEFVIENASNKDVGYQFEQMSNGKTVAMGPLKVGESKTVKVRLDAGAYRYRCPLNPTPWYELNIEKK